jgi:hypothetical protein
MYSRFLPTTSSIYLARYSIINLYVLYDLRLDKVYAFLAGLGMAHDLSMDVLQGDGPGRDIAANFSAFTWSQPERCLSDARYCPWRPDFIVDAIVTDLPYHVRTFDSRTRRDNSGGSHLDIEDPLLPTLVALGATRLVPGGRLVFYVCHHSSSAYLSSSSSSSPSSRMASAKEDSNIKDDDDDQIFSMYMARLITSTQSNLTLITQVRQSVVCPAKAIHRQESSIMHPPHHRAAPPLERAVASWTRRLVVLQQGRACRPRVALCHVQSQPMTTSSPTAIVAHARKCSSKVAQDRIENEAKAGLDTVLFSRHRAWSVVRKETPLDIWRAAWLGDVTALQRYHAWGEDEDDDEDQDDDDDNDDLCEKTPLRTVHPSPRQDKYRRHDSVAFALDRDGKSALFFASGYNRVHVVAFLLSVPGCRETLLNAMDRQGHTPLSQACRFGHVTILKQLLDAGANALSLSPKRWFPAYYAATYNHVEVQHAYPTSILSVSLSLYIYIYVYTIGAIFESIRYLNTIL